MDSQQITTATIDGLMSAVKQAQRHTQARRGHPVWVAAHFVFGGLASTAFIAVILCRLAGHQIGDELTDKYVFSLVTSVLLFAVGTLMIEQLKGDLFGGFLGRALAGCGLFVMSAQGYEFMQQTRACEVQHELLARQKANPVSDTATLVSLHRQVSFDGITVDWESNESAKSWSGTVSGVCAKMGSIQAGIDSCNIIGRASNGVRTESRGDAGGSVQF